MHIFEIFAIFTDFGLLVALMKAINRINALQEDVDNLQKNIENKSIDKEISQKEIMDAARVISEYCVNTQCDKCPYSNDDDGYCVFEQVPYLWEDRIKRRMKDDS